MYVVSLHTESTDSVITTFESGGSKVTEGYATERETAWERDLRGACLGSHITDIPRALIRRGVSCVTIRLEMLSS